MRFIERVHASGEKICVFAAERCYLASKGFPDFNEATRMGLAKEDFIGGLLPAPMCQQVRLMNPKILEQALERSNLKEVLSSIRETDLKLHPDKILLKRDILSQGQPSWDNDRDWPGL